VKIACVILAGGEGRRIGGGKPLRSLGGATLLDRAIDHARLASRLVAIAVREAAQAGYAGEPLVYDDPSIEGPLAGLVAALRFGKNEGAGAVLTIPSDMPFLPRDLAPRLETSLAGRAAAIASSGGNLHPVCGLWRVEAIGEVPRYLETGKRSLKGFAGAIGFTEVEWPVEAVDPFFNINTLADLKAAERLLAP
jgi:molybdopterin-guanine dinucleotide biosynthesis protein A